MNKTQQVKKVRKLLGEALAGLQGAIIEWPQKPLGFTSEEELASLYNTIKRMRDSLDENSATEVPGLWIPLIDTWPYTSKLRQKIVEAELEYERLNEKRGY